MELLAILTIIFGIAMSFGYFTQVHKIYKTKSSKDVSLGTYLLFFIGISMWLIYGLSIGDLPIIITNIVFLIGASSVIFAYFTNKH